MGVCISTKNEKRKNIMVTPEKMEDSGRKKPETKMSTQRSENKEASKTDIPMVKKDLQNTLIHDRVSERSFQKDWNYSDTKKECDKLSMMGPTVSEDRNMNMTPTDEKNQGKVKQEEEHQEQKVVVVNNEKKENQANNLNLNANVSTNANANPKANDPLKEIEDKYMYNNYRGEYNRITTFENLIDPSEINEILLNENQEVKLTKIQREPLYTLSEFYFSNCTDFSTESEWTQILKRVKYQNKALIAVKILSQKERRWNKENIILSDIIKDNRDNLDSFLITKFLNQRLKLQEHFNWLVWAVSYYYYSILFSDPFSGKASMFNSDEYGLPPPEHLDWLNGFEWKGIFIRVQAENQSKYLFEEMKALNYAFFEYIQIVDTYKTREDNRQSLLSNDILFPLISYSQVCGMVIVGSACITKYSYDMNENDLSVNNRPSELLYQQIINPGGAYRTSNADRKNHNVGKSKYQEKVCGTEKNYLNTNTNANALHSSVQFTFHVRENSNQFSQKAEYNNNQSEKSIIYDISHIDNPNNSFHSLNISQNFNKEINLKNYSLEDFRESAIFEKIEAKHLLKVVDDLNDCHNYKSNNNYASESNANNNLTPVGAKCKFMIVNALDLIPNLAETETNHGIMKLEEKENIPAVHYMEKYNNRNFIEKEINEAASLAGEKFEKYEGSFDNMQFSIFYCNSSLGGLKEKNFRINDYFLNIYSKQINIGIFSSQLLSNLSCKKSMMDLKNLLFRNKQMEILGKTMILYGVSSNIKTKYSLIKSIKHDNSSEDLFSGDYINKSCYLSYLDKFCKQIDSNLNFSINSPTAFKEYLHRYGINTSLEIFLLPKLRNKNISDLIKMDILSKIIRKWLHFHQGINLILKLNILNLSSALKPINEHISVLTDGFFEFIKENCLSKIHRMKIFYSILAVLNASAVPKSFSGVFYENLNYFFFFKCLKWRILDDAFGFKLFTPSGYGYTHCNLLADFISTARERPFLFLTFLESNLAFTIEPISKFKASISIEAFLANFQSDQITELEPSVGSYMKSGEISYYLFAKCIRTSKTSTKYDNMKDKFSLTQKQTPSGPIHSKISKDTKPSSTETNSANQGKFVTCLKEKEILVYPPNSMRNKLDIVAKESKKIEKEKIFKLMDNRKNTCQSSNSIAKMNSNLKVNSNNITMINLINSKYTDSPATADNAQQPVKASEVDSFSTDTFKRKQSMQKVVTKEEEELIQQRAKIWEHIGKEMDLHFPPILFKLMYKFDEKNINKKNVNKFLTHRYYFSKIDAVQDWKSNSEIVLNEIITVDSSESIILHPYLFMFIHSFFIENDVDACKEILYRMKEIMKNIINYTFEWMTIVNLFEGLVTERKNYIESEEFYSKCLIFSLLLFGDPRGRLNYGSNFLLFPLWKIGRQTCILENSLTNENFKEMFHCQDYIYKSLLDPSSLLGQMVNSLIIPELVYTSDMNNTNTVASTSRMKYQQSKMSQREKVNTSDILFDEDINENQSVNYMVDYSRNFILSEKIFELVGIERNKYFQFPSISDVKTSYNSYFTSENFINFLFKQIVSGFMHTESRVFYDEDYLAKINLNCYAIFPTSESSSKNNVLTCGSVKSSSTHSKKDKCAIFSTYMYDILMEKLNYKKYPPNGTVISWGNNTHNETTHNNYDFLSLPRVCYKMKDLEVHKLSCGWEHNVVITKKKTCLSWGHNQFGQCGVGGQAPIIFNPTKIDVLKDIVEVSCGNEHSLALNSAGEVYSWGRSEDGVLGYVDKDIEYSPQKVKALKNIMSISSGTIHNLALSQDGCVYSWGCSKGGQLGQPENLLLSIPNFKGFLINPTVVENLKHTRIVKISCGEAHSLALTYDGKVYGWGFTNNGQLGLGFCEDSFEPGQGMINSRLLLPRSIDFNSTPISDIQSGKTFSMFITEKSELLSCGVNDLNQLGLEKMSSMEHLLQKDDIYSNRCSDVVWPTPIEYFLNMKVQKLIEDLSNTVLSLWSWGSNRFGQLGQGNQLKKSMPKPINYMLGYTSSQVVDIACGAFHSACLISSAKSLDYEQDWSLVYGYLMTYSKKWQ